MVAPELSLQDEIYFHLSKIEEFKNLSMDRQGEICTNVKKLIEDMEGGIFVKHYPRKESHYV